MKIAIIGAGNVGSLAALRLAQEGLGEILLIDIVRGLAQGKGLDLQDARWLLKLNYQVDGASDIGEIKGSDIVVITAGLARRPGMTREELLSKNSSILKEICLGIKQLAKQAIVIVVTNPLDTMTYFALRVTGFNRKKVFGMGLGLDSSRFANIVSTELGIPVTDIDAQVIGAHGEGMLPLVRHSLVRGIALDEFVDEKKAEDLSKRTVNRGAEIVSLLGSGSAYFAPSAAVTSLVRAIVKDEKRNIGVSAMLENEYGLSDICIGVPARIGRSGIEQIIELDLNAKEKERFLSSADAIRGFNSQLLF